MRMPGMAKGGLAEHGRALAVSGVSGAANAPIAASLARGAR
ncbi:MAG: hypothetical protein SFX73_00755 [Kofleriaceae bacterium]|nr:hypothetical protein [Kofleriaceae bacterium]